MFSENNRTLFGENNLFEDDTRSKDAAPNMKTQIVDVEVQTALSGDIHLEPFEAAVERFRKQLIADRIRREKRPNAKPHDAEKDIQKEFKRIRDILGESLCQELEKEN